MTRAEQSRAEQSRAEQSSPPAGVSIRFADGSTFQIIHSNFGDGWRDYCAAGHPSGVFPNEAIRLMNRITDKTATPDDKELIERMKKALAKQINQ